jgi:hypothetical protein
MADPNPPNLPPIAELRTTARRRAILGGKIVYNEGAFTHDCRIRDLSEGGARILLAPALVIPTRVVLIEMRNAIAYESEVAWLKAPEFGLRFLSTHSLRGGIPPHMQYLKRYL